MLECNKNYAILANNCILKNSKEIISALEIKRRCRKNNIKYYINNICLQMLFLANTLLNSEPYTV